METQICCRCKEVKDLVEANFGITRQNPNGFNLTCKECRHKRENHPRAKKKTVPVKKSHRPHPKLDKVVMFHARQFRERKDFIGDRDRYRGHWHRKGPFRAGKQGAAYIDGEDIDGNGIRFYFPQWDIIAV